MKFKKYVKESIEDMHKRCEKCNTLLNDGGTCPKCDDGEEDYGDELEEAAKSVFERDALKVLEYVRKNPDCYDEETDVEEFLNDLNERGVFNIPAKAPGFKCADVENVTEEEAEKYIQLLISKTQLEAKLAGEELEEALTNSEKLKRAFPELNFDNPIEEAVKCEELSNMEKLIQAYPELADDSTITEDVESNLDKLKRAYPELNFEEPLTEGAGADTAHTVKTAMSELAKDDSKKWASTVVDIVDVIPDDFADELFDKIKQKFSNVKVNDAQKQEIIDATGADVDVQEDTIGKILDVIDTRDDIEKNAKFIKTLVTVILGIIAVIEPTPVVEIITAIVVALPENTIAKIMSVIQLLNPVVAGAAIAKKIRDDKNESLKSAVKRLPENFTEGPEDEEETFEYDDDYDFDDVEEDRAHAALYGGDRTYCSCGKKLVRTEWGGYCPDCDNADDYYDDTI